MSIFNCVKNVSFVVLDPNFRKQLFTQLIRISQNKAKTSFLINMEYLEWNEVFDCLSFFFFNRENPQASTLFGPADLQIFKHYIDNNSTIEEAFKTLCSYINFFVICNKKNINKIPHIFLKKMIVIQPDLTIRSYIKSSNNPYKDLILKHTHISESEFESMINIATKTMNEHFQDFISELQLILDFIKNLTSLQTKLEEESADCTYSFDEHEIDISKRINQLESKIDEAKKKGEALKSMNEQNITKYNILDTKITKELPEIFQTMKDNMCKLTYEEQSREIEEWTSTNNDCFVFSNIYKDIFDFVTSSSLKNPCQNENRCALVQAICEYEFSDFISFASTKLIKYNISGNNDISSIIKQSDCGLCEVSELTIVNASICILSLVESYTRFEEEKNCLAQEITLCNNRNKTNITYVNQLKAQQDEINVLIKKRNGTTECPKWMAKAWREETSDVMNLFKMLSNCSDIIIEIVSETAIIEQGIKGYTTALVAYPYGICSLPYNERRDILKEMNLDILLSPFKLIKQSASTQMLFPVCQLLNLFTQTIDDNFEEKNLSNTTSQILNTMNIIDQALLLKLYPLNPLFYQEKEQNDLLPTPSVVIYDQHNTALQILANSYHKAIILFTSTKYEEQFINCISAGDTLIIQIDTVKSGEEFFKFYSHIQLQLKATSNVQINEQKKPVSTLFKIFIVTTIHRNQFNNLSKEVVFADFSVDKLQDTEWFKYSLIFLVNDEIRTNVMQSISILSTKTTSLYKCIRKLSVMAHDTWPEYFENSQKMYNLKLKLEELINTKSTLNKIFKSLDEINSIQSEYSIFIKMCKDIIDTSRTTTSVFHLISSIKHFVSLSPNKTFTQDYLICNFDKIVLDYSICLPPKQRILFTVDFETKYMKQWVKNNDLLINSNFPNINAKQIDPILPQLINHICLNTTNIPKDYFTFPEKMNIKDPSITPIIFMVNELIPTDFIASFIVSAFNTRSIKTTTISSTQYQTFNSPELVYMLIDQCKNNKESLCVIYDEMLPTFIIPALVHYSHYVGFISYIIVVNKNIAHNMQIITNALYVFIDKPFTTSGWMSFIPYFPINFTETMRNEGPLLFYFLLLSHREDFDISLLHIPPILRSTRFFWETYKFENEERRKLCSKLFLSILETYSFDPVHRISVNNMINNFFNNNEPCVDISNDSVLHSNNPPKPNNIGIMVDNFQKKKIYDGYNWKSRLKMKVFFSAYPKDDIDCVVIKKAEISNCYINNGEVSIMGESVIDLYAYKKPINENIENYVVAGVYDGEDFMGLVHLQCGGNIEIWRMSCIRIYLPKPSS